MLQLIALNKPKRSLVQAIQANLQARAAQGMLFWREIADEVLYCDNFGQLQALPQPDGDYGFVIGPSGDITPEQLEEWLASSSLPIHPQGHLSANFVGKVKNYKAYRKVLNAHFDLPTTTQKLVVINDFDQSLVDGLVEDLDYLGLDVQIFRCESVEDLYKLPAAFYEYLLVGGSRKIRVEQLAEWMDAKIPKGRQEDINMSFDWRATEFQDVNRRHE